MRILTLCYEYPPIGGGGGRVAKTVAEGLVARGHEVRVQTAALGWHSQRSTEGGVEIFRGASGRRRPDTCAVHEMGLYVATSLLPALAHCRRWKPEVIHAHFAVPTGVLAWLLHRATGIPYVLTAHLGDVPGGVPEQTDRLFRLIGPLARAIWLRAAGATAVSGFVQELAERAYHRPVERILNGIDLAGRPALETLNVGQSRRLLFLGRLNPQKNAPLLIRALARMAFTDWKLMMIGDGSDFPEVRRLVEEHALGNRVTLAGWREAREVEAALRESDVLCLPSSSEGMPVAAVEALKFGLALATSDIPGVRDVARPGVNAITAPVGDIDSYARALSALLEDSERLIALRRGSWQLAEDFALPRILDAYERLLTEGD